MSLPSPPTYSTYTSPPLPRSRFKERLSRSSLNNTYDSTYDERCNPFAEEEGLNPFEDPPVPYRRRRSKKRAPIPPCSSNPDVNYGFKTRGSSKWSLTSSETDYTIDDKSEYSGDVTYSHSLRECLDNFNKEMDSLNKGSIEMGGSSPNIRAGVKTKILEETEFTTKSADVLIRTNSGEINNNVTEELNGYKNDQVETDYSNPSVSVSQEDLTENHQDMRKSEHDDDIKGNHIDDNIENEEENVESEELEKGSEEVIVYNETKNIESDEKKEFSIDEVKLSYIDQENSASEQNGTENSEDDDSKEPSPIPKLRKIKLDKEVLLGDALPE
ncbi:uncharacterized protein LOC123321458 isoform X2 [Coccinella septempunctata]|nr:uncharacterized protein LOC123321458 isoform X2 [Coccinella septempunctata]